jgi:pimeloyl-ACP methyl ester carboxylesterase
VDSYIGDEPRVLAFRLPARGGEMAVLDFGPEDRPVDIVFSHAVSFNARTYRTVLSRLAGEFRIFALDQRGHGASTLPAPALDSPRWPGLAADLIDLLSLASPMPVLLAGHSMGATISLLAAALAPEKVRGLALFEPALADDSPASERARKTVIESTLRRRATFSDRAEALALLSGRGLYARWSEAQLRDFVTAGFRDTSDGEVTLACRPEWEAALYEGGDHGAPAALDAVRCPVSIFLAETGSSVGEAARAIAMRRRFHVEVVAGTTHALPLERPALVQEALRSGCACTS